MGESFTWFPKLTKTVERLPEEQRGVLLWALAKYGTDGEEPDLAYPLDVVFEALRDDIDNSKQNRNKNRGGRPKKPRFETEETPVLEEKTPVSETENQGYETPKPKPIQTISNQAKPKRECERFRPPTVEEVQAYCDDKGYTFDAEQFVAFYDSKGWKVGRNPMKSWQAACTTWAKRERGKGEGHAYSEYD